MEDDRKCAFCDRKADASGLCYEHRKEDQEIRERNDRKRPANRTWAERVADLYDN